MEKSNMTKQGSRNTTTSIAKIAKVRSTSGSCSGVKYPCAYHCKKCFFDALYCSK